ncbi:protein JASON-like isoform X1 [Panicum hallii]|uniref:protein JASON-like isoform X1 n=1 Tax=Panicum hallii TaxID=206008 RepID=UPI000DF4D4EB|nr:protein JASON-like isoform X1 [Panicum hallii]
MRRCAAAIARAVVAFLNAVLVGCLLSCFRPRPRRGSGSSDALVHGDRTAEVLWDDDRGLGRNGKCHEDLTDGGSIDDDEELRLEGSGRNGKYHGDLTDGGIDDEELRREANYLKLCGTISETPAELQNECGNMPTNAPATNCASLFEATSSEGCEEHHAPSELSIEDTQHLLGVELVPHAAFLEKSPFQNIQHKQADRSGSPFATPLVLRDDMQTPGTIYTSHRGASISGKRVQTRKQFIYPVLRPIENRLQQMELTEHSSPLPPSNPPKRKNLEVDSVKKPKQTYSTSVVKSGLSETSSSFSRQVKEALSPEEFLDSGELSNTNSDEKNAAFSLSHWVKSSSTTDVENQGDVKGAAGDQSYDECSFPTERPGFNASDLGWDIENPTPRLPKTWDANGIPNTITRYKEGQRVSWHTTPFEERLLKVLSDEEHRPPRKVVRGKLFHLEKKAE